MAYQGEHFIDRYGRDAAARSPPVRRMLEMGVTVGGGTDATRVAWLVTGRTVGGTTLYPPEHLLGREEALRLYTVGSAWFSREESRKGTIAPGRAADLAVLSEDCITVPEDRIGSIESLLTIVDGRIVHAAGPFSGAAPPPLPVLPDWSPVARFGGAWRAGERAGSGAAPAARDAQLPAHLACAAARRPLGADAGSGGCSCFAF
jgi:hypothetical protein